jgi:hypothetical protein
MFHALLKNNSKLISCLIYVLLAVCAKVVIVVMQDATLFCGGVVVTSSTTRALLYTVGGIVANRSTNLIIKSNGMLNTVKRETKHQPSITDELPDHE